MTAERNSPGVRKRRVPAIQVDGNYARRRDGYNEIDLAVFVHVSRRDRRRRVVSEGLARCAEAALPLVETEVLRRTIGAIRDDDVRQTVAVEVSNGGVAPVPCRRSERRSNSEVPFPSFRKMSLSPPPSLLRTTSSTPSRSMSTSVPEYE
jgi:hypothetical protein